MLDALRTWQSQATGIPLWHFLNHLILTSSLLHSLDALQWGMLWMRYSCLSCKWCYVTSWKKLFFQFLWIAIKSLGKNPFFLQEWKWQPFEKSHKSRVKQFPLYFTLHTIILRIPHCVYVWGKPFTTCLQKNPKDPGKERDCNVWWMLWSGWALYWTFFSAAVFLLFALSIYFLINSSGYVFSVLCWGCCLKKETWMWILLKADLLKQRIYPTPFS